VNDQQLIDYCGKRCQALNCQFEGCTYARMFELAGKPHALLHINGLVPKKMYAMRDEMQRLVDLARKRLARPAGGLPIKRGRAYRDVNGEIRQVLDMPPHGRSNIVIWRSATESGQTHLKEFQERALEEVTHESLEKHAQGQHKADEALCHETRQEQIEAFADVDREDGDSACCIRRPLPQDENEAQN